MYYLKTSASFDSAHFLAGYDGKCSNIHGHHWVIEVKINGQSLQKSGEKEGMLVDFSDFKKTVRKLADSFDHALIYEKNSLKPETIQALESENFKLIQVSFRPTAENLAYHFYIRLSLEEFEVCSVTVDETPDNCAVYEGF